MYYSGRPYYEILPSTNNYFKGGIILRKEYQWQQKSIHTQNITIVSSLFSLPEIEQVPINRTIFVSQERIQLVKTEHNYYYIKSTKGW